MKSAKIHGILLAAMLLVALQTWTRNDAPGTRNTTGDVVLWDGGAMDDLRQVTFENERGIVVIQRRVIDDSSHLWATANLNSRVPGVQLGGSDSSILDTTEEDFPVGLEGDQLFANLAPMMAFRTLGLLDDSSRAEYELGATIRKLTVVASDDTLELLVGATVFGGTQRYALDVTTGLGYVISGNTVSALEAGRSMLQLRTQHRFADETISAVTIRRGTDERSMIRNPGPVPSWSPPGQPMEQDGAFTIFVRRVDQMAPIRYASDLGIATLTHVVRIDYTGVTGAAIGFLDLYRTTADSTTETEYYIVTEATRIPAFVSRSLAERVVDDLPNTLGTGRADGVGTEPPR